MVQPDNATEPSPDLHRRRRGAAKVRQHAVEEHLPARAGNRRFGPISARHTHKKAPCKTDLLWETLGVLNRPARARTAVRWPSTRSHLATGGELVSMPPMFVWY
jgi:hypothetical protein